MILTAVRLTSGIDPIHFAWAGLSRFQNISFTAGRIHDIQQVPNAHAHNVKKQAEQIRYCLVQAREYFIAARAVTSATKPLLLYYGLMSLALAEILMKQSGDSSIDRARAQHSHHGLTLIPSGNPSAASDFAMAAASLGARPHSISAVRSGTFELWHRSSRETPIVGRVTNHLANGARQETFNIIAGSTDKRMRLLPEAGMSLLECFKNLPSMKATLEQHGILPEIVRGRLVRDFYEQTGYCQTQVIFHPFRATVLDAVYENFTFAPSAFEDLSVTEMNLGCILTWAEKPPSVFACRMPNSYQDSTDEVEFCINNETLNEFGLFYVALYILGNYARYFPEQWMLDVEKSTSLSLAAHELVAAAEVRVPLLALSEISRVWHLSKI